MPMLPATLLLALAVQDHPGTQAVPRDEEWMVRHNALVAEAKKGGVDVMFLGDSITQGWQNHTALWGERFTPLKAANFGISGDCTQHVLWRLRNGELDGIQPRVVMLLIGTNNIGPRHKQTVESTVAGITAVVKEIQQRVPKGRILLLGVFPRGETVDNPFRAQIKAINTAISTLDDGGRTVRYLDIGHNFLEANGSLSRQIMPDFLHLTDKGYRIWADAVKEPLQALLKAK